MGEIKLGRRAGAEGGGDGGLGGGQGVAASWEVLEGKVRIR